jgi:5'(3')-deoxyribonucleotidase
MIDTKKQKQIKQIKPHEIAFDFDDVVCDFIPLLLKVLKEDIGLDVPLEQITEFNLYNLLDLPKKQINKAIHRTVNNPISLNMRMKPGAKEVIIKLLKVAPVYFVTARKNGKLVKAWIDKALGFSSPDIIIVAMNGHDSKARALKIRGKKYFVDDRLETCYQLCIAGIEPIVFTHPHNVGDEIFVHVDNWKDIEDLIDWS